MAIAGATVLIVGALLLNGTDAATDLVEQRTVQRVVNEEVSGFPGHSTLETRVDGDRVAVVLSGPVATRSPNADDLAGRLSEELGRDIEVELRIRLETQETSAG